MLLQECFRPRLAKRGLGTDDPGVANIGCGVGRVALPTATMRAGATADSSLYAGHAGGIGRRGTVSAQAVKSRVPFPGFSEQDIFFDFKGDYFFSLVSL